MPTIYNPDGIAMLADQLTDAVLAKLGSGLLDAEQDDLVTGTRDEILRGLLAAFCMIPR